MKQALICLEQGPEIRLQLFEQEAPGTVANFAKLANSGFTTVCPFSVWFAASSPREAARSATAEAAQIPFPVRRRGIPISMCAGRCLWRILDQVRGPASFYLL